MVLFTTWGESSQEPNWKAKRRHLVLGEDLEIGWDSIMIRLTRQTDYGIVLMTHLALDPSRVYNAPELAVDTHFPLPTVSKILKMLARDGLLASQRGVKGGYALARDPSEISVAQIISALEGPIALTECVEDDPDGCSYQASCRLRGNWQLINNTIRNALDKISLRQMTQDSTQEDPLSASPAGEPLVPLGGVMS